MIKQSTTISPLRARTVGANGSVEELFRLQVLQAYDITHADRARCSSHSRPSMPPRQSFRPTSGHSDRSWALIPSDGQMQYANAYLTFQPWWTKNQSKVYSGKAEEGSFSQLSYNYIGPGPSNTPGVNANYSQFLTMRSYYELFDRMGVYFAPSYDFVAHQDAVGCLWRSLEVTLRLLVLRRRHHQDLQSQRDCLRVPAHARRYRLGWRKSVRPQSVPAEDWPAADAGTASSAGRISSLSAPALTSRLDRDTALLERCWRVCKPCLATHIGTHRSMLAACLHQGGIALCGDRREVRPYPRRIAIDG